MMNVPELFGSMVFNDSVMRERLPHEIYKALRKTIEDSKPLDPALANVVANAMKDWAIEKGVTHYTHWFQPLTGVTAEKHDSFLEPQPDGTAIMEFSGKALIQGEPDASSFPSGGLRATFEARGYTAWDPTSPAFIKDNTLCIPTAFCSYGGEALDSKTPLLRSMKTFSAQAKRLLKLLGHDAKNVYTTTGIEQEYFLVDRQSYNRRKDLIYTGRTLFGTRPPKGQEVDAHYFGSIKMRVSAFMRELDEELWKLGVPAKTEHNEAAPAQHELAPIFETTNIACDHNQLIMEIMRKVAKRHGLTCLLHEKPFARVNGSGKHNNWSICTDDGANLLDPGKTPEDNIKFLLFFCAVIKAVDEYQDLLRISIASSANDHRLGGHEAPPAIVSMYIGEELEAVLTALESGEHYNKKKTGNLEVGVDVLPSFKRDTTDRNRTSPFAFTGNKFEFRMPGSSMSVAIANTMLNTIVAEALSQFSDELEKADDVRQTALHVIQKTIKEHKRILFNGNGYDEAWVKEAERRGLHNLRSSAEAIPHLLDEKNVSLLEKHGIFTRKELGSRCEIMLEAYCKNQDIEARTMLEMAKSDIMPLIILYLKDVAATINAKKAVSAEIPCMAETKILEKVSKLTDEMYLGIEKLENAVLETEAFGEDKYAELALYYRNSVFPAMCELRETVDNLEVIVGGKYWPYPSYGTLLYRV